MIIDDLQPLFPGLIKDPNGASVVKDDLKMLSVYGNSTKKKDGTRWILNRHIYIYITYM